MPTTSLHGPVPASVTLVGVVDGREVGRVRGAEAVAGPYAARSLAVEDVWSAVAAHRHLVVVAEVELTVGVVE